MLSINQNSSANLQTYQNPSFKSKKFLDVKNKNYKKMIDNVIYELKIRDPRRSNAEKRKLMIRHSIEQFAEMPLIKKVGLFFKSVSESCKKGIKSILNK